MSSNETTDDARRRAIGEKLTAAKERWAAAKQGPEAKSPRNTGRGEDGRRLPRGQRLTTDWPVLDLGIQPNIVPADWQFTVAGLVNNPIDWNWQTLMDQPQTSRTSDIHCVTTWSRYDNVWEGVSARHLLEVIDPKPEAKFVMVKSYDGYSTNIPIDYLADDSALLAHTWEGDAITREHGGPVRLVIPALYFWKSAKWIRHMTFMESDQPGFWEARGYHMLGDPWKEQRYG